MQNKMMDGTQATIKEAEGLSRRKFLTYAGAIAGAGMFIASCKKDNNNNNTTPAAGEQEGIDLGTGDVGLLNYLYALEQLAADFYLTVTLLPYEGMTNEDLVYWQDIKSHSIAHRELLFTLLGSNAIPKLDIRSRTATINFKDKATALSQAQTISDIMVLGYGSAAGKFILSDYLLLAGKIVSVKARHSAFIRDIANPGSFASNTDGNGIEAILPIEKVLEYASAYIPEKLSAKNLPLS